MEEPSYLLIYESANLLINNMKPYMKYAGLGIEILASMLFCVGIGYALDKHFEPEKPWFTLCFSLLGCVIVIYIMIRSIKEN